MPITLIHQLRRLDKDEFRQLDYAVMSHAFASQNELGRLCEEEIYQKDLAIRIEEAGIGSARIEFPINIAHKDFATIYSADLVVAEAAIYELKTVKKLGTEHRGQLLNYLLLTDQPRGKLVNFRSPGVESEFINSALSFGEQREFNVDSSRWTAISDRCQDFQRMVLGLADDWGVFLETSLYVAALTHFLGGEPRISAKIPLTRRGQILGTQPIHLLTPEVAFRITALKDNLEYYDSHLRKLLFHSELQAVQWVSFCQHVVQFATISR
jgi:GxxExxY protein